MSHGCCDYLVHLPGSSNDADAEVMVELLRHSVKYLHNVLLAGKQNDRLQSYDSVFSL